MSPTRGARKPAQRASFFASHGSYLDAKGRPLMGGVAAGLAKLVSKKLNVRTRSEKLGILCRAFSPCRSSVDARKAYEIGRFTVESAVAGKSEVMVAIRRWDTRVPRMPPLPGLTKLVCLSVSHGSSPWATGCRRFRGFA